MVITKSDYGDLILAKVVKKKSGSGSASDKLTILTLCDCDCYGNSLTEYQKMLCWNSDNENGSMLSDRAKKLQEGELITARVIYDIGDPSKCTCYEMKKTGLYKLVRDDKPTYVLAGTVTKITENDTNMAIWIPVYVYMNNEVITNWYRIVFWNETKIKAKEINKGDFIAVRGQYLKKASFNNREYYELTGGKYLVIKGYKKKS